MKVRTRKQRERRNLLTAWGLVAPALVFMILFTVVPVIRSIWLSFTKFRFGMEAPEFIGLQNYIKLMHSTLFWKIFGNTIFFV